MTSTESRTVQSFDGATIAYRVFGTGELTVLLSNGIGCNQALVEPLIQALAQRYRVVLWDYRAHVDSPVPQDLDTMTVHHCLGDMEAVVADLGVGRMVLAGYSMGVQIEIAYFERHPEQVQGIIVLLGPAEYPLRDFLHIGRVLEPMIPGLAKTAEENPRLFQWVWHAALSGPWANQVAKLLILNPQAVQWSYFDSYRAHLADFDVRAFLRLAADLGNHSAAHVLPTVSVPALVVAGEKDNFTPLSVLRRIRDEIPDAEYFEVKDATHGGLVEFPDEINARVTGFIARHFG
jgi:pimeloyl-ACP methyl ester carboxylesterase